jgi:hypothetical protein
LRINPRLETPFEKLRDVKMFDLFEAEQYHYCYDGRSWQYIPPKLSPRFLTSCSLIAKTVKKTFLTEEELKYFYSLFPFSQYGAGANNPSYFRAVEPIVSYIKEM